MRHDTSTFQDNDFKDRLIAELPQYYDWVLDWVSENFYPDDVFDIDELETWALNNGYVKEQ